MLKRRRARHIIRLLISIGTMTILFFAVFWGSTATQERAEQESLRLTEQNIRRAAVQCYALEGEYPRNMIYLEDHYGVRPNYEHFVVYYQFIGSNLLPDITVISIG